MMFTPTKKRRRTSLEKGGLGTDEGGEGMRRTAPAARRPLIENDGRAEVNCCSGLNKEVEKQQRGGTTFPKKGDHRRLNWMTNSWRRAEIAGRKVTNRGTRELKHLWTNRTWDDSAHHRMPFGAVSRKRRESFAIGESMSRTHRWSPAGRGWRRGAGGRWPSTGRAGRAAVGRRRRPRAAGRRGPPGSRGRSGWGRRRRAGGGPSRRSRSRS